MNNARKNIFFLHYHNGVSSTKGQNVAKKNLCSCPDEAGLLGPLSQYKSPTDIGYFFRASVVMVFGARKDDVNNLDILL
jgi:hypothetical protein